MILRFLKQNKKYCIQHGIAKSGAKVLNSKFVLLSPPKTNFIRFLFLNLIHKNSFWLASVQNRTFSFDFPAFGNTQNVVGNYTERPVNEENIDIYTFNFTDTNHVFSEFWRFSQNCKGETS